MPATILYVNDKDIGELGFTATGLEGWANGVGLTPQTVAMPGMIGHLAYAGGATSGPRAIQLTGIVEDTTATLARTKVGTLMQQFRGLLECRAVDATSRVVEGMLAAPETVAPLDGPSWLATPALVVRAEILCPDPTWRDRYVQGVTFGATATTVPAGDLPMLGTVRLMGAATNPTVTLTSAAGVTVATMVFTVSLGATEYLDIDMARRTITRVTAGTASTTDTLDLWTSDTGPRWFAVEPGDKLSVSSGSGLFLYYRRWRG